MRTIIDSFERVYVLVILFQLYGSKTELFGSNFWLGQYDPNLHIGRRTNPIST